MFYYSLSSSSPPLSHTHTYTYFRLPFSLVRDGRRGGDGPFFLLSLSHSTWKMSEPSEKEKIFARTFQSMIRGWTQTTGRRVCVRIGIVLKFRQHIHSRQAFVLTTPQGCTYVCKYIRTVLRFFEVLWHIIVTLNLYSIKCSVSCTIQSLI